MEAGKPTGYDRVRGAGIVNKNFELETLQEVYTTKHWLVRTGDQRSFGQI
jgi:dolichyl-diphosphooligosaccharide--protein glycosyltransferase